MRLDADVRRCVLFLGNASDNDADTFRAVGTAFFVNHERFRFLVTAQHIAAAFGDAPFCIRVNNTTGGAKTMSCDILDRPDMKWLYHPDPNVDLALMPFNYNSEETGMDMLGFPSTMLLGSDDLKSRNIDVGDRCYAVGLFRLLQGSKRNVPIVHSGSIALMAGEEAIPVRDWREPHSGALLQVDAHLVEMTNLKGLSGAPIFVAPTVWACAPKAELDQLGKPKLGRTTLVSGYDPSVKVLGIWSASWDAHPAAVATEYGDGRVPVGVGTVVPASKLLELLNDPRVVERRATWHRKADASSVAVQLPVPD